MVKVIKNDKSVQVYKESKIVKACKGAGVPEPVAKTIAKMISLKLKGKTSVKSSEIKNMALDIIKKIGKASSNWISFKKKK
jgi:transcriptional regulator NrdR family protein